MINLINSLQCRPVAESAARQDSTNSFAERLTSNGHSPEPATPATPTTAGADLLNGGEVSEAEDFRFPWAGEPFWQVGSTLKDQHPLKPLGIWKL